MRHNVTLEGWNCRLRPVELSDAGFIVNLRNQNFAKGFIHATDCSVEKQEEWICRYFERDGDYYWIIENIEQNRPVGTNAVYDIVDGECMPGRWVMLPDADLNPAALNYLVSEFIFDRLKLNRAIMDVVASNKKVVHFHRVLGEVQLKDCPKRYEGQNAQFDFVWFAATPETWHAFKAEWEPRLGPRY